MIIMIQVIHVWHMIIWNRLTTLMQINASNISYLPSITCAYNGSALSATLAYIRNCIDTQRVRSVMLNHGLIFLSLYSKHN